jgi:hypothetical protein
MQPRTPSLPLRSPSPRYNMNWLLWVFFPPSRPFGPCVYGTTQTVPNLAIATGGSKDSANGMVCVPDLPILKSQGIPVNCHGFRALGFNAQGGGVLCLAWNGRVELAAIALTICFVDSRKQGSQTILGE